MKGKEFWVCISVFYQNTENVFFKKKNTENVTNILALESYKEIGRETKSGKKTT